MTHYETVANIKGPQGPAGPRGLPGFDAVPADSAIAALVAATDSATGGAIKADYVTRNSDTRRYGAQAGRRVVGTITGRDLYYGAVVTSISAGVQSGNIPLAMRTELSGVIHSGNTLVTIGSPATYVIEWGLNFTGAAAAGVRQARLMLNGNVERIAEGYGQNIRVQGSHRVNLEYGAVISLRAFSGNDGAVTAASEMDAYLTVRRDEDLRIPPALIGWSGASDLASGMTRDIHGNWLPGTDWTTVGGAGLASGDVHDWIVAHPDRAVDIASHLIPVDMGAPWWSSLMDEVVAGTHDATFATLGTNLATHGPATVYWRPWWEFNLSTWRPNAAKFIATWQHAIPLVRAAFAAAADPGQVLKILWCFSGLDSADEYWPGGSYVDLISLDTYSAQWGTTQPTMAGITRSLRENFAALGYYCAAYSKPACISEWGNVVAKADGPTTTRGLGDSPDLIDYVMDLMEQHAVEYAIYFNLSGGGVGQTMADTPNALYRFAQRAAVYSRSA